MLGPHCHLSEVLHKNRSLEVVLSYCKVAASIPIWASTFIQSTNDVHVFTEVDRRKF